jgi:hypothetical protein
MLAPLAGLYETGDAVLEDIPHEEINADEWVVSAEYAHLLEQMGLEFYADDGGALHFNPKQPVLVVSEPVTDILDQFEVPYQRSGSQVLVDLAGLTLPTVYGHPTEA